MGRLFEARAAMIEHARLLPGARYLRASGIDFDIAEVTCGGCYVCPVVAVPPRSFEIDEKGGEGIVVEALAEDGVTVLDLVTWRPSQPDRWRTLLGAAPAFGMAAAVNPGSYFDDLPLQLYRTPLEWLQARCDGVALLDPERGVQWLLSLDGIAGMLAPRDDAHAAEIEAARLALATRQRLVVPVEPYLVPELA